MTISAEKIALLYLCDTFVKRSVTQTSCVEQEQFLFWISMVKLKCGYTSVVTAVLTSTTHQIYEELLSFKPSFLLSFVALMFSIAVQTSAFV